MSSKFKQFDNPQDFFKLIPKNLQDNIQFRIKLHKLLAGDKKLQAVYKEMILCEPKIAFNSMFWTFNPQLPAGYRNVPFILWPHQEGAIDELHTAKVDQYDIVIHKSRKEGATEILKAFILIYWLLEPEFTALVGSEKADKVDRGVQIDSEFRATGMGNCLFSKLSHGIVTLPEWIRPKLVKTYMHLENLDNSSFIDGESTNVNFGVSDRRNMILVDEIGVIEPKVAESIISNLPDVCNCNIYNSTHKWGPAHPYNKLLTSGAIKVVRLMWFDNPEKSKGLYITPEPDVVIFKDVNYWKEQYPAVFMNIQNDVPVRWTKHLETCNSALKHQVKLTLDGGDSFGEKRSPWLDAEIERRGKSKRYVYQNILAEAIGANDSFFTPDTIQNIKRNTIKKPKWVGYVTFENNSYTGKIDPNKCDVEITGQGPLQWFAPLVGGRPDQSHQYVLTADTSRGVGSANAVCGIFDANTHEQVGMWVDPNTPEERFADNVWALSCWVGGDNEPFLIWEANGAGAFENRLIWQGARNVYYARQERLAYKKRRQNKRGWWSTPQTKRDLLGELDVALGGSLQEIMSYKYLIIRDMDTVKELEIYIDTGVDIVPAYVLADTSGARVAHGDRVIACALAVLAFEYISINEPKKTKKPPKNSLGARIQNYNKQTKRKRFLFVD